MKKIFITSSLNEKKIMFNWIKFSFRLFLPFLFSIIFIDKINAQLECANELPVNYIPVGDCNYPTPNINYTIPVYFHEVYSSVTANPSLSPEYLQSILNQINEEFTLYGLNIQFVMAKFDEKGSCFTGLKFHDYTEGAGTIYQDLAGSHIADDEIYPNQADRDFIFSHYLNLWLSDVLYAGSPQAHSLAKGFGVFPEEIEPFPSGLNGNNVFFNREQFDAGLFCHEIGHNFGLFHIFEGGGCNAPNDCDHGDRILSIPSCQLLYINNEIDCKDYKVCNSNIDYPAENFMSYTDPCRSEFVEEQYKRMAKYIDYFQPLSSSTNLGIVLAGNSSSVLSNPFTINQNHTSQRFETTTNSTLFIDGNVELNDCDLFLGPSSKIIVKTGSTLTLSATLLSSTNCSALLWQGIEVEEGASLIIKENTVLENAYIGVFAKATSTLQFENTIIRDCYVGVKLNEKATPPNLPIPLDIDILKFSNVQILGSSNLLFHLEHSTSEGSYAGIQIDDVSLAPFVSGNATINTIQGFKYGILSKGSTLLAENMELQKNAWGVKTSSYTKKYFPVILKNIDIFDCTVGVDVDQASTYINDLNFWTNDIGLKLNRCYGGEVINCNQTLTRIPNVGFKILNSSHIQFDNNYIIGEQDNLFSNCHNLKMNNCTIDHFTFNAVRKSSFSENTFEVLNNEAHGIIAGGNDNVFECNYYFSLVGDALVNDNSPDNTFRCNEFEGFAAGMVFEGNSVGTDFEANSFNSSNIGLYLKGWDSQIGLQVDKGNIFPGFFDEIGAKNENSEYFFSLIINNNNLFFNPSHSPNDWFLQNSQESAAFCGNSCINGAGDDFVSWEGEQYSKCLDSLFYGSKFSSLSTKAKWNLLFIMYRKNYLRDTTLLNNRECLKSILRYFKNSNLHRAVFAYDVLVSPQPLSDLNLRIAITDLSDGYVNDEVNTFDIDDFKEITDTYLSDNLHNLDLYYQIMDSIGINFAPFLNEEDPVSKVGVVFPILNKYLNGESISSFEVSELLSIAESCARDVGPSKYYAMSTLQSLDLEFQNTDCYVDNNYRISIEQNHLIEKAINFQLLDIGGRAIINATEEIDISTLQIPFGVYILSTRFEDGTIKGEVKIKL